MIIGIGLDAEELSRVEEILQGKPQFAMRVLTKKEMEKFQTLSSRRQTEYLTGRWCAKEAYSKAIGTGIGKLSFHDLEILNHKSGQPYFSKHPFEGGNVFVSITHTKSMAFSQVVIEKV